MSLDSAAQTLKSKASLIPCTLKPWGKICVIQIFQLEATS